VYNGHPCDSKKCPLIKGLGKGGRYSQFFPIKLLLVLENWVSRRKFYQKFKTHPEKIDFRSEFYPGKNVRSNTSNLIAKYINKNVVFQSFQERILSGQKCWK
jgi:hypothetical protein